MKKTGTFATKEELQKIKDAWEKACNTPVIILTSGNPDMASIARREVKLVIDSLAMSHGLKSMSKFYSFDLNTGEFMIAEEGD